MSAINPTSKLDVKYFNDLMNLAASNVNDKYIDNRISQIFEFHSDNLIADLLSNPNHAEIYLKISENLKKRDFQTSIGYIQTITSLLKNYDFSGLGKISEQIQAGQIPSLKYSTLLSNFSRLTLPQCMKDIRDIEHPGIRAHVLAALINRDKVPLKSLGLSKTETFQLGPHLKHLDCKDIFDQWSKNEIDSFISSCKIAQTVIINTYKITELPDFPECKFLDCTSFNLLKIGNLPRCETLNCSVCRNLTELPPLPRCHTLICSLCSNLTKLSALPVCKDLRCSNCTRLTEISGLQNCEYIDCQGCTSLIRIGILPLCIAYHGANCSALRSLPAMRFCEYLDCTGCVNLTHLPRLNSCERILYEGCPILDLHSLPERFRPADLPPPNDDTPLSRRGHFNVKIADLNEDPLKVLLDLEVSLNRHWIPQIKFVEADGRTAAGVDAGGLSRILISRLMQSLVSHGNEPKQLDFKAMDSDLFVPVVNEERDLNVQIKGFQLLGAVFAICYGKSLGQQGTPTGIIFDRKLFESITHLSFEDLSAIDANSKEIPDGLRLKLISRLSDKFSRSISNLLLIPPKTLTDMQFQTLKDIALASIDEDEENLPSSLHKSTLSIEEAIAIKTWVSERVKKDFIQESKKRDEWLAAVLIAKQLQLTNGKTPQEWNHLLLQGAAELEKRIQGIVNRETFLSSISWNTSRRLNSEKIAETQRFVTKWINEASIKDLEGLNNFIAGSPTINPQKKLAFVLYDTPSERLPTTHTCSFQIDLTVNYVNYDEFKKKLETALANVNSLESSSFETV